MAIRHVFGTCFWLWLQIEKRKKLVLRKCYFIVIGKMGIESDHHWAPRSVLMPAPLKHTHTLDMDSSGRPPWLFCQSPEGGVKGKMGRKRK